MSRRYIPRKFNKRYNRSKVLRKKTLWFHKSNDNWPVKNTGNSGNLHVSISLILMEPRSILFVKWNVILEKRKLKGQLLKLKRSMFLTHLTK